jgi:hypothetical protein
LLPLRCTHWTSPRLSFDCQPRHSLQSRVTTGHLRSFQAPPRNGKRVSTALPKHRPATRLASTQATLPLYGVWAVRPPATSSCRSVTVARSRWSLSIRRSTA